jgi:hypothetical protein
MTHQEIYQNTDTFNLLSLQRLIGVRGPKQSPANYSPGFLYFHQIRQRKTTMNLADVSLAAGMGIAAGVVISGILVIAWFLAVTPRRTKR